MHPVEFYLNVRLYEILSFIVALWECLSQRKKPTHVLTMTDIIPKAAANSVANPVNDSVYLLAKWLIQNRHKELAAETGVDPAYVGFVEAKVNLESIPSHLRAEDCSLDKFPDDIRGAIRIVDKEGRISFLASDNKSLINKMVDFTSNTLDIFIIGDVNAEKAEALKDSTDWKSTTEKMIALQKEWKTIGSVARKHSDAVWKRFITACDYFFEQKNKNVSSQKSVEQTNLAAKKALIEKINTIDEADHDEALATLKGYMTEWNAIGHVPFKEKDKIYKEYHEAVDKQFDRLKVDQNDRKMQTFRNSLSDMSNGERGKGKLYGEREKLMRMYERMKNELQTYENNIGFLSISSKGGGGLLKEMERKIDKLKDEMALIIKKIDAIDENLE